MPYDREPALLLTVETGDEEQATWAWSIHRDPDRMLILRSRPEYTDKVQAAEAGAAVAAEIGRKLRIPVVGQPAEVEG